MRCVFWPYRCHSNQLILTPTEIMLGCYQMCQALLIILQGYKDIWNSLDITHPLDSLKIWLPGSWLFSATSGNCETVLQ